MECESQAYPDGRAHAFGVHVVYSVCECLTRPWAEAAPGGSGQPRKKTKRGAKGGRSSDEKQTRARRGEREQELRQGLAAPEWPLPDGRAFRPRRMRTIATKLISDLPARGK